MNKPILDHPELNEASNCRIVFTSYSKKLFYLRAQISAFVLDNDYAPFNPYMNFEYNLSGTVNKRHIRIANNTMIKKCHELWVFGDISDGVLTEIYMARTNHKKIRYFVPSEDIKKFKEIKIEEVGLEDVSAWMWEYVLEGKKLERWHPRLRFYTDFPIVYPAYSKRNFYWQMHISKFCIDHSMVPLNPFMLFRYFMSDIVSREKVYTANNAFLGISDEIWTFGEISNGVLAEMIFAKSKNIEVRHYKIVDPKPEYVSFRKISRKSLIFEEENLKEILARRADIPLSS